MHVKDIKLTNEWQDFATLVSVNDMPYRITNTTNSVMWVCEGLTIPTSEKEEGVLSIPAGRSAIYQKGSQNFYIKGASNNKVVVYQEG